MSNLDNERGSIFSAHLTSRYNRMGYTAWMCLKTPGLKEATLKEVLKVRDFGVVRCFVFRLLTVCLFSRSEWNVPHFARSSPSHL